jgi:hypothetical protein
MQDLQNELPTTPEEDEEFKQMENIGLKEMFAGMGSDLTGGKSNTFDAPIPQPSGENPHNEQPNLEDVLQNIAEQFALLYTVIRKEKLQGNSQPDTTPPEGNQSLQETVALVLQQADWFKDLIRHELIALDISEIAKDAVEDIVENEVESYFDNRFDPEDHFDFGDAVSDAVDDRIDDIVRERVMDSLEEVVAEKLSEASIKIELN